MAHFPGKARHRAAGFFIVFTLLAFLTAGGVFPVQAKAEPVEKPNPEQLKKILADFEHYAQQAQKDWQVPGMAIAIVAGRQGHFCQGLWGQESGWE